MVNGRMTAPLRPWRHRAPHDLAHMGGAVSVHKTRVHCELQMLYLKNPEAEFKH